MAASQGLSSMNLLVSCLRDPFSEKGLVSDSYFD
jgi:hypothetical protein